MAQSAGLGFVFEAPTWRANTDWGRAVGYDQPGLDRINERAIAFLAELAVDVEPAVISGCLGPRSDGYAPTRHMSADEACAYHRPQLAAFARAGADQANAMTITYAEEAIGIVAAAGEVRLPVSISFTLETDGRLPDGTRPWPTRSPRSMRPPTTPRSTSESTARILITSRERSQDRGKRECGRCAPMRRAAATLSSTRPPNSTPAIRPSWPPATDS